MRHLQRQCSRASNCLQEEPPGNPRTDPHLTRLKNDVRSTPPSLKFQLCPVCPEWHHLAGTIANSQEILRQEGTRDPAVQFTKSSIQNLPQTDKLLTIAFAFKFFSTRTSSHQVHTPGFSCQPM